MSRARNPLRQRNAVIDFGHSIVQAVFNRLLHARDSRFVAEAMQDVVTALQRAEQAGVEMPLQLQIDGLRMCHDGRALDGPSLQARSLLERCAEREIATLSFGNQLTAAELNRVFDLLLLPENVEALTRGHREATMCAFGIRNVRVSLRNPGDPDNRRQQLGPDGRAIRNYQQLADALQENHRLAHRDQELAFDAASTAVESTLQELDEPSMLLSLSMQDDVDRFTVGHSVRVALLALQVARGLGASRDQLVRVGSAALMHDIGKSKVPQEVLFKQGRLTKEEWHWMAQHPRLGAQLLIEQHEHVDPRTVGAAFCHHMSPNGRGYPDAMMPMQPSATSCLIRVCDVFEALTAVRPYKRAMAPIEAFAVMLRNADDFDARWLNSFVKTLGLFPNGTRVELADGSDGVVVAQGEQLTTPTVRLLTAAGGEELPADHPETVVIGEPFEGRVPRIASVKTQDRELAVPEFDPRDPATHGPTAHDACLGSHHPDHDHAH